MNKRFSTLLAAALVAGGLSFNADAISYSNDAVKDGSFIHLGTGTDVLSVSDEGIFGLQATTDWTGNIDKLLGTLWQVKKTAHTTAAGVQYTYSFVNRLSGQALSIKLQSDNGTDRKNIEMNEKGTNANTDWAWDDAAGLYCVKNFGADKDSVFQLSFTAAGIQLNVTSGTAVPSAPTSTALTQIEVSDNAVILTADDFNALVKKEGGRLFFTDENVSSAEKNVLTDNKWEAVDAKIATDGSAFGTGNDVLYLKNGKTHKRKLADAAGAEVEQNEYLLVDYNYYDPLGEFNKLIVDTIAVEPDVTTTLAFNDRIAAKHHSATAAFKVTYFIPNDSMVIAPQFKQTTIPVATTLGAKKDNIIALYGSGKEASYTSEAQEVYSAIVCVGVGVQTYAALSSDPSYKFASDNNGYEVNGSTGSAVSGNELIKRATKALTAVKYSTAADTKKLEEALVAAAKAFLADIEGLTWKGQNVVTTKKLAKPSYVDGLSPMTVDAFANSEVVVIRKLSNTKVLTIGKDPNTVANGNLVATIKTSDKEVTLGGDAEITEGIYYVIDAKKGEDEPNENYGKYYDYSPVNVTDGFVSKAQAFNPFAQFVVTKAAGVDKGNYSIDNRGDENEGWYGVTNVVDKDNNIYAIEGDTIQLVAAEGVDKDNAYIGYKYMTANDAKNNKFTITSAAEMLAGQSIIMKSDSVLAVGAADEEVLYTLVPSDEEKYGLDEKLKRVSYTIMNADSAYIIEETYKFSNGKYGEANGTPAKFYMIAVDTDSTFVLTDGAKKLVVSTQYKTISAEDMDARNDMFLVKPQSAPASYMSLPKHVRLNGADGNSIAINSKNQGVAVREGDELKAAYGVEDLTFWLDTAAYDNADPFKYYITRGVKATEETAASRLFMYNAVDSTASKLNKEHYTYGTAARVIFRTAEVFVKDTLFVPTMDATAKIDTVSFAKGESADGLKHAVKAGINNFQFSFEFAGEAEGQYNIVCRDAKNANPSYVHNINGVLAMGAKEDALVVAVEDAEAPTANEGVEVSEVTVIAGEGQVTIAGAAGKKVVISNILGQTVANTAITSDNATIAAPQGVVVVAVEGEEAVKAIVK